MEEDDEKDNDDIRLLMMKARPIPLGICINFCSVLYFARVSAFMWQHFLRQHSCNNNNNIGDDGHLHCGCRWSPSTSRSTVVDLDSLIATMQQNINNTWQQQQQDLDLPLPYTCDPYRASSTNNNNFGSSNNNFNSHSNFGSSSNNNSLSNKLSGSLPTSSSTSSSIGGASRNYNSHNNNTYYPIEDSNSLKSKHSLNNNNNIAINNEQSSLLGGKNILQPPGYSCSPQQLNDLRQLKTLIEECSDKTKRDSGVLVEEPDVIQDTNNISETKRNETKFNSNYNSNNINNKYNDNSYDNIDDDDCRLENFSAFLAKPCFPPVPQLMN
ncbi:hypothetical protein HELRODRAFT_171020 [Helobdella robusta]|uniref:Uncharacterized protein n=1 Tax=Helobdella robusta TaxID=6412 RepID=T1F3P9_HELRO|nr:hypothetical protein HELRODRAFT_171020 [Helobdella robusta]ESO06984.1 hypothetical protein HELRODRAFT_171020 [Helobdella robusta]